MKRALLSVWDKTRIVDLARGLKEIGFELMSTSGTAKILKEAGLPVLLLEEVTGFPEILSGRVKTIHPIIAAGLLARRGVSEDLTDLQRLNITPIDLVAVNLYPFGQVAFSGADEQTVLENIDIGGVTLLRAAAKNYPDVIVLSDLADYSWVLSRLRENDLSLSEKRRLAMKAFQQT
ncbi:MAG: hypothetical protein NZ959_10345, partial [Armatimonadetes bacterium]|nr:hypothetical protein [Armatimonadota bacterium]